MRVLVVEDEKRVANFIRRSMAEVGYAVDCAHDGEDGLSLAQTTSYDVIVLDLRLPRLDGLALVKTLRRQGITTPVLAVTAKSAVHDRVEGLHAGCDDYLSKPFAVAELVARVQSLLRRRTPQTHLLQVGDLVLDTATRRATRAGRQVELTPREFALLEYLMRNAGQVVTRTMIEQHVWNYDFDSGTNLVEVHLSHVRRKVDRDGQAPLIHTIRGTGYALRDPPVSPR